MAKREPKPGEEEAIHDEMLRHLEKHPPDRGDNRPNETAPPNSQPRGQSPAAPNIAARRPRIMLRHLPRDLALERLGQFLLSSHHGGEEAVIVVVGRGQGSPGGRSVLRPAVLEWCRANPGLVARVEDAPPRLGGGGALVVHLETRRPG